MSLSRGFAIAFIKFFFLSLLSFFLIPGLTYTFVEYAKPRTDEHYRKAIELKVNDLPGLTLEQRQDLLAFVSTHPPLDACASEAPEILNYRDLICPRMVDAREFQIFGTLSWWTLIGGVGVFVIIFALGGLAFVNRAMLYYSFLAGWRILVAVSVVAVIVQGAFAVWLSLSVPYYFFDFANEKLFGIAAISAITAAGYAIWWLFKKTNSINRVEGELLLESAQPVLWSRVRALAKRLETAPPDHIVAGIDCNFFVAQAPLEVNGRKLSGRTLFVSLPLLRQFSTAEADAVLAHELAHFRGGDVKSAALLSPKLSQFDLYCNVMAYRHIFIATYVLQLYRLIFELALKRDRRKREFIADRAAATAVSAQAVVNALIKLSAYGGYRGHIESSLFQRQTRHEDALSIADRVAAGLQRYAASSQFIEQMRAAQTPHPFDSHPPLIERMRNVGLIVDERHFAAVVTTPPGRNWADDISCADAIERKLWSEFEESFAKQHEISLAFRYLPANKEEEAVVLRSFPNARFPLDNGKFIEVTYAGINASPSSAGSPPHSIAWDDVEKMTILDKQFFVPHRLSIRHTRKGILLGRITNVPLPGIANQLAPLHEALYRYRQRHQIMRQVLGDRPGVPSPEVLPA